MYTEPVKKIIAGCVFYAPLAIMPIYIAYFCKNVSSDFVSFCIVLYCFVSFFALSSCFNIILFCAHFVIFLIFERKSHSISAVYCKIHHIFNSFSSRKTSKITIFYLIFRIDSSIQKQVLALWQTPV